MTIDHPYSPVTEHGGLVFVSGAAGIDYATNEPVAGDRASLDAALGEVERRLGAVGLGLDAVIKANYFVVDVAMRAEANAQFIERFSDPRPARTFVAVAAVPYGARVAIEAVARR
jgi:enamine deaminase RidA (YjgF/YER057c/UK114 family)